ncbi:MAG: hydrolase [Naasia sp.]|jgi:lysophospholipase L1-like esterase|uniref:SGNH/GDSL hydrolase family protein n=1 Tax=Naasia sp. TaxID=2546198 RepID=UPI0026370FCF|nr:SGNH/GDSL hydrolase family protein [Naasia sp.]MCU1569783.1 hydrolase [Naasia sp.]
MTGEHAWRRYVALGDSFTEGIGDPEPGRPGSHRGWADRVAEVLAQSVDDFAYANLAVRGKLLQQVIDQQIEPALALLPDLITLSAGGNDVIRPGADPDALADKLDGAVSRLAATGATIVLFTGTDVGFSPVFTRIRGRIAIYNENIRKVAQRHGTLVADQWALTEIQDARMWDRDRLHLAPLGHHTVARMVLRTLGVENDLQPMRPESFPSRTWRQSRTDDLVWARKYFVPWAIRRIRRVSSGDSVLPKRPEAGPYARTDTTTAL